MRFSIFPEEKFPELATSRDAVNMCVFPFPTPTAPPLGSFLVSDTVFCADKLLQQSSFMRIFYEIFKRALHNSKT